jgi:hypothetical protein
MDLRDYLHRAYLYCYHSIHMLTQSNFQNLAQQVCDFAVPYLKAAYLLYACGSNLTLMGIGLITGCLFYRLAPGVVTRLEGVWEQYKPKTWKLSFAICFTAVLIIPSYVFDPTGIKKQSIFITHYLL